MHPASDQIKEKPQQQQSLVPQVKVHYMNHTLKTKSLEIENPNK